MFAALAYAPIAALEWKSGQEDRYVEGISALETARADRATSVRLARDVRNDVVVQDMKSWALKGSNLAIVQVALEQQVVTSAEAAGLTNVRITTDSELELLDPVTWLGAEIQADLRWASIFAFFDEAAQWPEGFRVTRFAYELLQTPLINPLGVAGGAAPAGRVTIKISVPVDVAKLEREKP